MIQNRRPSHVLVIAPERSPSLALVATYPLGQLEKQGLLKLCIRTAREASAEDLAWSDIVFAVRPATAAMAVLVSEAKRMGRVVMCHWDDDLLSIPPESSSYTYFARPGVRKLTLATLLQADVVLSSSEILVRHLRTLLARHGKSKTPALLLPVPALRINPASYYSIKDHALEKPFTIGYAGSVDQTAILQRLVVPALETLWQKGLAFHLQLVGPKLAIDAPWQKFVSSISPTDNYEQWLTLRNGLAWDAAVAPLQEGHFYRCKYANKYIEFASAGIPCLFSNTAPFSNVVANLKNGYLVENTVTAWASAIESAMNGLQRQHLAASAMEDMLSNHSIEKVAAVFENKLATWLSFKARFTNPPQNINLAKKIGWIQANVLRRYL